LKQCQTCGRELQDPATTCAACDEWAAAVVESPKRPDPVSTESRPAAHAAPSAAARRKALVVAASLSAAALLTIAFMLVRRVPSSTVSAAPASVSPPPVRSSPTAASLPVATQSWSAENKAHWLGDQRGAAWELPADDVVQTWFGPTRPLLVVRCMSRTMDAIVFTGSPMMIEPHADGKAVTVTVDNEETSAERWMDAERRDALFAPEGAAFAQRLLHATTLQFGYTPHNFSPVVARFHVTGLAPLIEHSARECGWKTTPSLGGRPSRVNADRR
jgi:hypothetical protein